MLYLEKDGAMVHILIGYCKNMGSIIVKIDKRTIIILIIHTM
jgi:hypothetical protein